MFRFSLWACGWVAKIRKWGQGTSLLFLVTRPPACVDICNTSSTWVDYALVVWKQRHNGPLARRGLRNTMLLISFDVTSGALVQHFRWPLMYSFNGKCSHFQTSIIPLRLRYRILKECNNKRQIFPRTLVEQSWKSAAFRGTTARANCAWW